MQYPTVNKIDNLEAALGQRIGNERARDWVREQSKPYRELMSYYRCALMEVETKFRVLSEELSIDNEVNPIEEIKSRLKSPESIVEKAERRGIALTVDDIEKHMNDIAGVRVICSYESDVYMLADALLRQSDVGLVEKKDYIANPKGNGYRSLHLIIAIPIFLHDRTKIMKVEVQLRTLAMNVWATLEHKLAYKKDATPHDEEAHRNLLKCAELTSELDRLMSETHQLVNR